MQRIRRLAVIVLLICLWSTANAQQVINYGDTITQQLTVDTPSQFYSFNANAGDIVTVYALGHNITPALTLLGATGQLAFSNDEPATAFANDASVTYRIPQAGAYNLLLGTVDNQAGTVTLTMQVSASAISTALTDTTTINIPAGAPAQTYSVIANEATTITVTSTTAGFAFRAVVRDSNAQALAMVNTGIESATFRLPASNTPYDILVSAADPNTSGTVQVAYGTPATTPSTPADTSTSNDTGTTSDSTPPTDPTVCTLSAGNTNVRSGPGTDYNVIGALAGDNTIVATGQNGGWYVGNYNGIDGWVFGGVVTASGNCGNLSFVAAPANTNPVPPPQTTEEVSAPPSATPQPTQASNDTSNPPPQPTATTVVPAATATTAVQIAPVDADPLAFDVHRDNGGTFSNTVSYPDGDTRDRIITEVNLDSVNSSREVQFILSCNGTGTQNVTFHRGSPNAGGVGCGQSITWRYAAPYRTQPLYVQIQGGDTSYVAYTITATIIGN